MSDVNHTYYTDEMKASPALEILQLYDAGRVQRFHTVPDYSGVAKQNLADHSWGVAMLCMELCKRSHTECSGVLLRAALTHDLAEYWTADLPAHVKWENPRLAETMDHAQHRIDISHGLGHSLQALTDDERRILWWADRLELYLYSRQRARAGAVAYTAIVNNIRGYIEQEAEPVYPLDQLGIDLLNELTRALA